MENPVNQGLGKLVAEESRVENAHLYCANLPKEENKIRPPERRAKG